MSEYKKVKIGDFLTESKEESFDSDASKRITVRLNCKGIEQRSLKAEKEGATKYFVRHSGQFIYGKQNFHKGAFGIIPEKLDGFTSSADLPAFDFTNTSCCPEYLNLWFQVDERYKRLQKNVKGVGSQRLAVSIFLNQEILLPDLETQKEIVKKVSINLKNVETLTKEIESQKAYAKQFRQNILQDAIEGKLTAEWRKTHPVIKGNPDFDVEALFEEIRKEKKSDIKQKELAPISDDEKPFEIPEGWKWVRLGFLINYLSDFNSNGSYKLLDSNVKMYETKNYAVMVRTTDFENGFDLSKVKYIDENAYKLLKKSILYGNEIIMNKIGSAGKVFLMPNINMPASLGRNAFLLRLTNLCNVKFVFILLNSMTGIQDIQQYVKGALTKTITKDNVRRIKISLPPLAEQTEIVKTVENLLIKVDQLETQIAKREEYTNQLMQSILKDAFEER